MSKGPGTFLSILACLAVLTACDASRERSPGVIRRDSAAIRIIENPAVDDSALQRWGLDPVPALDIGGATEDSTDQLHRVTAARILPDGNVMVANAGSLEIRTYSANGALQNSFGRRGQGPGEFRSLDGIMSRGDTIFAADLRNARITAFTLDGNLISTFPLASGGVTPLDSPLLLPDGSLVTPWMIASPFTLLEEGRASVGRVVRSQTLLVRQTPGTLVVDSIGPFAGFEEAMVASERGAASMRAPFAHNFTFTIWNGQLAIGTQDRYEVAVYSPQGSLSRLVRAHTPDLTITPERLLAFHEKLLQNFPSPENAAARLKALTEVPRPELAPAYGRILGDDAGNLWVAEYSFAPIVTPMHWDVFDVSGTRTARVAVPDRFHVFQIGADYVLGLWRDSLDVEHVRKHMISK